MSKLQESVTTNGSSPQVSDKILEEEREEFKSRQRRRSTVGILVTPGMKTKSESDRRSSYVSNDSYSKWGCLRLIREHGGHLVVL